MVGGRYLAFTINIDYGCRTIKQECYLNILNVFTTDMTVVYDGSMTFDENYNTNKKIKLY